MAMEEYKMECHPMCRKESVVQGEKYRITVLTPALVRLEYSEEGKFEDRATQMVMNRDFPVPEYKVVETEEELAIYTDSLQIHYDRGPFSPNGLVIKVVGGRNDERTWHYGAEPQDLRGTSRTLDHADGIKIKGKDWRFKGETPLNNDYIGTIEMDHGVISRTGFSVIDDSTTMALTEDGWIEPRTGNAVDKYFFGYSQRYLDCLKDFYYLCGKTPLLPRYALGNWWSRYHRYTETEYKELVERFEDEKLPFSVAVVDMDWHLVDDVDPKYGSGWTGYTWNKEFFPDPKGFMTWLHEHNMKITLNVHPADGIRAYEDLYPQVAEKMGIDPASELPVDFDPTNPKFMEVYFKDLHHPLEEEGVDFWWLDWQQGNVTRIPGLDPLWMLNHYHYLDSKWKGNRALTFSRYAGPGSHRYPVGFSGDTVINWDSLRFQPYFTNTASNVGYGWWSHDIGGHMHGERDDELMARWTQYGVFSPINRLHSTDNPFNGKEPWKFDKITEEVMDEYLLLRHKMVPYLYTMNRRASRDDLPLIMPLYYLEPDQEEAYQVQNEYYFGSELLVSPIVDPQDTASRTAKVKTWLPKGEWVDFFTGMIYRGGRMIDLWRNIYDYPVLMKAGAIVPMKELKEYDSSTDNPADMEVKVFPAADGSFTMWEDAGDTAEDLDENWVATKMTFVKGDETSFTIAAADGNLSVIPEQRTWKLVFAGTAKTDVVVTVDGKEIAAETSYCEKKGSLIVTIPAVAVTSTIVVSFPNGVALADNRINERCYDFLERAQIPYDLKSEILAVVEEQGTAAIATLTSMELDPAIYGSVCELLTAK